MKSLQILCLIAFLLTILVPLSRNASLSQQDQKKYKSLLEGQGLYSPGDNVEVLSNKNFNDAITNSGQAWLVEFYNSWCGFCQRFAPSWKALATDIKAWNDLVRVAAIDCSVDDNFPICREYEIMGYPTLRYFHESFQPGPKNLGIEVKKGDDVNMHRRYLVERIIQEQKEGRGKMYPKLELFSREDPMNMLDDIPQRDYGFLIVEDPASVLGEEVALDLHKARGVTIRVAHTTNSAIKEFTEQMGFPALVALDKNENVHKVKGMLRTRDQVKEAIREFLFRRLVVLDTETDSRKEIFTGKWIDAEVPEMGDLMEERARQALRDRIKQMGDVVLLGDLETALRHSLRHEVPIAKVLKGEKLEALKAYLRVIAKYFPLSTLARSYINTLIAETNQGRAVRGRSLARYINLMDDTFGHFSSPKQWLACKGSTKTLRGYPCGLWKMFHYLTVNATLENVNNQDANPREVLEAMYGYIKYFFGCAECSGHFVEMAERRHLENVSSFNSSILWLWDAHNEVNQRLHGDITEDPEQPKIQFPSSEACPLCGTVGRWNETEVLNYLKNMYGNLKYIGSDIRILNGQLAEFSNSTSEIKTFDMSMCFILYVSAFLLLAVLIRMFLKRGYRKKPYVHDLLGKV